MAYRSTIDGISAEYHSIIEPKVKVPITPMLTHCRYFSFFIITTRPVIGLHSCFHVCGFPQGFIAFNFGYFTWKSIWWVVCSRYLERHLSIPNYYIFLPLHYRTSLAKCIYMCYYKKVKLWNMICVLTKCSISYQTYSGSESYDNLCPDKPLVIKK